MLQMLQKLYLYFQGSVTSSPSKGSFRVPEYMRSRNNSYMNAVSDSSPEAGGPVHVRAGMQKVLQVFITNAANVFLLQPSEDEKLLDEQVGALVSLTKLVKALASDILQHEIVEQLTGIHYLYGIVLDTTALALGYVKEK